jgi:hypothetical protein
LVAREGARKLLSDASATSVLVVRVRSVAAEDAEHGMRRVVLRAPDVEGEHLVLALEVHDLVHRLRHRQRVDEVALDLNVFAGLVGHQVLRGS